MSLLTFAEMAKLGTDDLQAGLAESVITVSDWVANLPVVQVSGNAYAFNRENSVPDGALVAADGTYSAPGAIDFSQVTLALKGIVGQHDVTGLSMAQGAGGNAGNDPAAIALAVAAKGVARKFEALTLSGTVGANAFDGIDALLASGAFSSQLIDKSSDDAALSFDLIDDLVSRVQSKGRRVDFIMGNAKAENKIKALMRAAGGVTTIELNGKYFTSYDGIPFIRNDYISSDVDGVAAGSQTNLYAGNWEEGGKEGVAMVLPVGDMFRVEAPFKLESADLVRHRLFMYGSLAVHNLKGIAMLKSVTV